MTEQDGWKQLAGNAAAALITDDMLVGLGTGSTAVFMIHALAERIRAGLHIIGAVASSQSSYDLASNLGNPMTDLDEHPELDLYLDGADEIDPQLQLIKGAGGALLREKIVASASRRFVVIGDTSKLVQQLGMTFPLPIEVVPFAITPVQKQLAALDALCKVRQRAGKIFISDNHNMIIDCTFVNGIIDAPTLNARLHSIPGVVETGLFLHMAHEALIGGPGGIQSIKRSTSFLGEQ